MITFFFTFKDVGGVQVLIFNLMRELFRNNIRTKLIYHKDSWLTTELDKYNIGYEFFNIEDINKKGIKEFIHHDDIIVPFMLFKELIFFRKINPFLLFWSVYPYALGSYNNDYKFHSKLVRKRLIKKMVRKSGLVFMDDVGVNFIENQFGLKINASLLSIPISIYNENKFLNRQNINYNNKINVTYLGRSVDWKVYPVIKVINDINNCKYERKEIVLHIITDDVEYFKKLLKNAYPNFEIKFYSGLSGDELSNFLITKSDLHIAMGTSCLEGSSLGIPSILIDFSFSEFPNDYLYRWIFENEKNCLGEFLENSKKVNSGHSFSKILSYYEKSERNGLSVISDKCFKYTNQNHSIESVAKSFMNSCMNSNLKITDVLYNDLYYVKQILTNTYK
jgi:hypothetical protein